MVPQGQDSVAFSPAPISGQSRVTLPNKVVDVGRHPSIEWQ